jgi:TatA/E family protein of Tat protein translocase
MFNIGPLELLAILVVALLVFGPEKLPEMGKQVGKAMREFKKFQASMQENVRDIVEPIAGPIMPGSTNIFGGGPPATNVSGGPLPTENNVPRSATIQNPQAPEGEAAAAPSGSFGHYGPVEPPPPPGAAPPQANGSESPAPPPPPAPPSPGGSSESEPR